VWLPIWPTPRTAGSTCSSEEVGAMSIWNRWRNIEDASSEESDRYGVSKIRILNKAGIPIQIPRVGGIDKDGIVYIGRSGSSRSRSLAARIGEFRVGKRSGGWPHCGRGTYDLMMNALDHPRKRSFLPHAFQYRTMHLQQSKEEIERLEVEALATYFAQYGELPPCNSSFPKWEKFSRIVNRQTRSIHR
jgi:hypothetical protein